MKKTAGIFPASQWDMLKRHSGVCPCNICKKWVSSWKFYKGLDVCSKKCFNKIYKQEEILNLFLIRKQLDFLTVCWLSHNQQKHNSLYFHKFVKCSECRKFAITELNLLKKILKIN